MSGKDSIYHLSGDEVVTRALFTPSFFEEDGSLSPAAFHLHNLPNGPEKDISVLRKTVEGYEERLASIANNPREENDVFCGTAELLTQDIKEIKIPSPNQTGVIVSSTRKNNVHASIYFCLNNTIVDARTSNSRIEFLAFARKLVSIAQVETAQNAS